MDKPPLHLGRPARILVTVLDDPIRSWIAEVLRFEGYDVVATASADDALRVAHESPEGLIIVTYERDAFRNGYEGLAAFTTARRPPDGHVVIVLSADPSIVPRRIELHADEVVLMPWMAEEFLEVVRRAQRLFRTQARDRLN